MENVFGVWKDMFLSPEEGFSRFNEKTKILWPLLVVLCVLIVGSWIQLPVVTSQEYRDFSVQLTVERMEEAGQPVTDETREMIREQLSGPLMQTMTFASTFAAPVFSMFLMCVLQALFLLVACRICGREAPFLLLFKFMIFLFLFQAAGALLNSLFLQFSDWRSSLLSISTVEELQNLMAAPFSLAVLLDREAVGRVLYYIIDFLTNIFTLGFYVYCALGLEYAIKISRKQAIIVTISLAVVSMLIGMVQFLFM